jgi:ParB family transcriptional regulator, chromosome partitioning protein
MAEGLLQMTLEVTEMATTKGKKAKKSLEAAPSGAFFDIPLELIIMEGQIRSRIDQEGEAFLALVESIREKGVLEPVIVTSRSGKYRLISGERRLLACRKLGLATIPARMIDAVTAKDEILALQLTENLQRADLDPIDTAQAVVGYFQARYRDEKPDTEEIINTMISLEREPQRVEKEVADTVSAMVKISGKSLRSLERTCSLLKLPEEIKNALREGTIGVSQGYIFAANLDHPCLMEIFQEAIEKEGFTNAGLERELKKGRKPATESVRKRPFSLYRRSVQSVRSGIEEQVDAFKKSDLQALLKDLRELIALVEGRLPEALDDGGTAVVSPKKKQHRA